MGFETLVWLEVESAKKGTVRSVADMVRRFDKVKTIALQQNVQLISVILTKLVVTGRWVTKLEERPMRWEKVPFPFLTETQTHSTQRERERLLGGHRRAFRPFQFKHDISKVSTESRQSILIFFLVNLLHWRANTDP